MLIYYDHHAVDGLYCWRAYNCICTAVFYYTRTTTIDNVDDDYDYDVDYDDDASVDGYG